MRRALLCTACTFAFAAVAFADDPAQPKKLDATDVSGMIKKVDTSANMLTVTVKDPKAPFDREFKLTKTTKFVFLTGDKQEVTGFDAYKIPQFKEGAAVTVLSDGKGTASQVHVGAPPK